MLPVKKKPDNWKLPPRKSIRSRLLFTFVLVAVLPAIAISVGSTINETSYFSQKSFEQLESLIALKGMSIDSWIDAGQNKLINSLNETYVLERLQVISKLGKKNDYYDFYKNGVIFRLNLYLADTTLLKSISLIDLTGKVILSTDPAQEGKAYSQTYLQASLKNPTTWVIPDSQTNIPNKVIAFSPVYDQDIQVVGLLAGEINSETFPSILSDPMIHDDQTRIYLVDSNYALFDAFSSTPFLESISETGNSSFHSEGIDNAIRKQDSGYSIYRDYRGVLVYGVWRWIPGLKMALIIEQDLTSVYRSIFANQIVNLMIIVFGIVLAVALSILTSRQIADPLLNLSQTASQIASGDLEHTMDIKRDDEIGILAEAFNSMTAQLKLLINDLERRVEKRTSELQASNQQLTKKALQMETTSQVSREITSILNLDDLLTRVVHLIQESFDYYHVSIYLMDQETNRLSWRAGTNPVSLEMQNLTLDGESITVKANLGNRTVLANNVDPEISYLYDKSLPEAQSELVIPLRMGEKIIGTMVVYETVANAFSQEDLKVLQGLGDQIAIAINNALLYERTQKLVVLEERNRMARELHDSISQLLYSQVLYADASSKTITAGQPDKAVVYVDQLQKSAHQALKEMRLMIYELRPSILVSEGLWGSIKHRLDTVEQRSGLEVHLTGDQTINLSPEMERELYLITQESLNNVLKHSQADRVDVSLSVEGEKVFLSISDSGIGFVPSTVESGLGLNSIREHAERMGGHAMIESAPGQGTKVSIVIPIGVKDG